MEWRKEEIKKEYEVFFSYVQMKNLKGAAFNHSPFVISNQNISFHNLLLCNIVFGIITLSDNHTQNWVFGEKTFRIFLCLVTFTCIIKMTSIFFQAVGKPIRAVVASMIRDIVCFIPLIIKIEELDYVPMVSILNKK